MQGLGRGARGMCVVDFVEARNFPLIDQIKKKTQTHHKICNLSQKFNHP
jgi:hypothetical protein